MKTKVIAVLGLFLFSFAFATNVRAQEAPKVQEMKELPWYFPPGVIHTSDPVKQKQEYLRYLHADEQCWQGGQNSMPFIPGSDSIRVKTDVVSTASMTENPTHLMLVFDNWVLTNEGVLKGIAAKNNSSLEEAREKFYVRVTCMNSQRFISKHEFEVAKDDLLAQAVSAADHDFAYYHDLEKLAVASRAKKLGIPEDEFRKSLDEKVDSTNVTYREFNMLPKPHRRSDFIPRELHLAPSPKIQVLGVAWLDTGIVYYNPQARVRDYLVGRPGVLQHEIIHANINMEEWPMQGFDEELVASIPEMVDPTDTLDLFSHGYARDLREWIEVYTGVDFEEAHKQIYLFDAVGQITIDEEKYREVFAKLAQAQAAFLPALKIALSEFYSDRLFWTAMNDRRSDDNTVFSVMLAIQFDPVALDGHQNTMLWLKAREDKIRLWAKNAWEKTKSSKSEGGMSGMYAPTFAVELYKKSFTEQERHELEARCYADQKACSELLSNPTGLLKYLSDFQKAKRAQGGAQ